MSSDFEPPTNNSKQRKTAPSATNQVITRPKGPFDNFKDNKQYSPILKTLETVYCNWYHNKNNNNDKPKCSSLSIVLIPDVILELIVEYSTEEIYKCWCSKKNEILVMNDDSIYPSNHKCLATICDVNGCYNVIFRCNEHEYDLPPNRCTECGDYLCDNCMNECSKHHPCCDGCLVSCNGDYCVAAGAPFICISHHLDSTQFTSGEYNSLGIKQCDGCDKYYCDECASFGVCYQCKKEFCSQCHRDWFCTNEECDDYVYICINCNKDEMN